MQILHIHYLVLILRQDRKHIVKAIKPHVERMSTSDEAQLVLFSALDIIEYVCRFLVLEIKPLNSSNFTAIPS